MACQKGNITPGVFVPPPNIDPALRNSLQQLSHFVRQSRLQPAGDWAAGVQYGPNVIVRYEGSTWISVGQPPVGQPPTINNFWFILAEKGDQGEPGPPGEDGMQPPVEDGHFVVVVDSGGTHWEWSPAFLPPEFDGAYYYLRSGSYGDWDPMPDWWGLIPAFPGTEGHYLLRYDETGDYYEWVRFADPPTADGDYVLRLDSGVYSWVPA